MFFADTPSRCASSAWMLCKLFWDKWAVRHVAAQSPRLYVVAPGPPELHGYLYGSFAFQFAARAQALLPAAPLKNKVMAPDAPASSLALRRRQMIQRSVFSEAYESPQWFGPRGCNSVLDNVVGALALALIANVKYPRASRLRHVIG